MHNILLLMCHVLTPVRLYQKTIAPIWGLYVLLVTLFTNIKHRSQTRWKIVFTILFPRRSILPHGRPPFPHTHFSHTVKGHEHTGIQKCFCDESDKQKKKKNMSHNFLLTYACWFCYHHLPVHCGNLVQISRHNDIRLARLRSPIRPTLRGTQMYIENYSSLSLFRFSVSARFSFFFFQPENLQLYENE